MLFRRLLTGPLEVNCYCIAAENEKHCVVIDPGDATPVLRYLEQSGLICSHILLTHGHFDHVLGVAALKEATGAKVLIHEKDAPMLAARDGSAASFGIRQIPCEPDEFVHDGDILHLAGLEIKVLETPGHTPGGVCYYLEKERVLFSGDTLFRMSIGRTDFPNSNEMDMRKSILEGLFSLSGDFAVYPGHMDETTLEWEKQRNPFVRYWKEMMQ